MPAFTPIEILDRMAEIVRNDMLERGSYLSLDIVRPVLAEQGAICGGRNACAVGALWLAGDITPLPASWDPNLWLLPGVEQGGRHDFLVSRPALRAAYHALNLAAEDYATARDIGLPGNYSAPVEDLFEGFRNHEDGGYLIEPKELLPVIEAAKHLVTAA